MELFSRRNFALLMFMTSWSAQTRENLYTLELTKIERDIVYDFDKNTSKLVYVPRYNPETDTFESDLKIPDFIPTSKAPGKAPHSH